MSFRFFVLLLSVGALGALASCGRDPTFNYISTKFAPPEKLTPEVSVAASKLREHCKACHAVGEVRFIWTDNDSDFWHSLFVNVAPNRGVPWADAIKEVLSWPSDSPPPASPIMDPIGGRDWMPRGGKRLTFAEDIYEGEPVRRMILRALHEARSEPTE